MADSEDRKPEVQTETPASPPPETDTEETPPEVPVPTDLRRNLWLLIIIVGVILAAWVAALIWKGMPQEPSLGIGASSAPSATAPPGARGAAPRPQPRPRQPIAQPRPPMVAGIVGTETKVILAAGPRALPGGTALRSAQYFDVSRQAAGFETQQMIRLPRREADQLLTLLPENLPEGAIELAADCTLLQEDDRVVSLAGTEQPLAYPLRIFRRNFIAVYGAGGRQFCLTWNRPTQCARAFAPVHDGEALTWRDSGLNYRGNTVLYDQQTGSLWDGFTGLALTGPLAGATAQMLPAEVWPWREWREAHPDGRVLTATLGLEGATLADAANEELALGQYLRRPTLPAVPIHFDPQDTPLPPKTFVLGVSAGGASKAFPLGPLAAEGTDTVEDTVGGEPVRVVLTSPRTAYVEGGEDVTGAIMLWFAWKDTHPETEVFQVARPETEEADAGGAAAPPATAPPATATE